MAKIIGMPDLQITFKYLGTSAIKRGERGQAILIVKEEKIGSPIIKLPTYNSFDDDIQKTFSEENIQNIKDVLIMQPRELLVVRMNKSGDTPDQDITTLTQALKFLGTNAERNCWISVTDMEKEEAKELSTFVDEANKYNRKRYKAVVYKYDADSMHVVNFTTETVKLKDKDEYTDGVKLLPTVLGAIVGQSLDSSIISKKFTEIEFVIEPEDMDKAVDNGEFFFYNDDGAVRVGRGVNSLTTIVEGMTNDMKFILVVEVMDLIYTDIHFAWSETYKGKFKNTLDNQMLFISAINAYYTELSNNNILDGAFDNAASVDIEKQRLANIPIYGEEEVSTWNDNRIMEMTVGTNVYLGSRIKIANAMEDLYMDIFI